VIELLVEAERALSFGLVDRAEAIYRQVAESDPHNSIAVVGLARVALERGDDPGAYRLARRALEIDPENEAAQRLAMRLDEVIRTRGEAVPDAPPQGAMAPAGGSATAPPDLQGLPPAGGSATAPRDPQALPPEAQPAGGPPRPRRRRSVLDRLRRR
jgi:tetratricopeptide (TPR) repeat protein